jgi:Arc/MetJ family transcription regulator
MRTAIEIDDELMARAMQTTGLASKAAVVHAALQSLVGAVPGLRLAEGAEWRSATDAARVLGRLAELDFFAAAMGFDKAE